MTNAQYVEFLNAKAASDPFGLYNPNMGSGLGGIARTGSSGSFTYSVIGFGQNRPVNYVSFYDAARFTNWLNNGQGTGDTETGAYTLLGGTPTPSNGTTVTRNADATIFLPSENEWYKAAYYNAESTHYFEYPTRSDFPTICAVEAYSGPNAANCGNLNGRLTFVGSYSGSASPYGTFDQGGNVSEWNEEISGSDRGMRGGSLLEGTQMLAASSRVFLGGPIGEFGSVGFRVAMIPEPGSGLLVLAGLLGFAGRPRMHAPRR